MAAIHTTVFEAAAQMHRADDIALHAFLEQLMAGQYDVYGTSPDLRVQVCFTAQLQCSLQANGMHSMAAAFWTIEACASW